MRWRRCRPPTRSGRAGRWSRRARPDPSASGSNAGPITGTLSPSADDLVGDPRSPGRASTPGDTAESSSAAIPACSASARSVSRSAVNTGVSTSSPTTTPAWRAAIVQPPWIACGERPASAASVSAESVSASPAPTSAWGGRVSNTEASGRRPRPARPPAIRITPAAARAGGRLDPAGERRRRERADGHHGDRRGRADRAQPPALDQQQHDEEERRGQRRRDQRQGGVGGQVRTAGGLELGRRACSRRALQRGPGRARTAPHAIATGTWTKKIDCHEISSVSRPPIPGPSAAPSAPDAAQTVAARRSDPTDRGQQLERGADRRGAADRLHAARREQQADRAG